jgi:tyrosine-specific transport protein
MQSKKITKHNGVFSKHNSVWDGIALIMSGTIGAGVLGLPYVVAKVGVPLGIFLIVYIGVIMTGLNLLIGEVAFHTGKKFQLVGLARTYLGKIGEYLMAIIMYTVLFGVLVVYMIGVGDVLYNFFGGVQAYWSLGFFAFGMMFIYIGMRTIKVIEFFLTFVIFAVVILISVLSVPHIDLPHIQYIDMSKLLLPYGVILFAFHGTTAVPEVYSILKHKREGFKHAILFGGLGNIVLYSLFAVVVVGVTGLDTTEIATLGLGEKIGPSLNIIGNVFAVLAMSTAFLMTGLALRDSFRWDFKIPTFASTVMVAIVPLIIFLAGLRNFIDAIDIFGGVFMSLEIALLLLIYWRAKTKGHVSGKVFIKHGWFLVAIIVVSVSIGMIYNLLTNF